MALSADDRLALQELMARYAYAIDIGSSEDEFLALFTDDAVLVSPIMGRYEGRDGVKRFRAERAPRWGRTQVRHVISNSIIDGDETGNGATIKAYLLQFKTELDVAPGTVPKTEFLLAGYYDCVARKIGGSWKLEYRADYLDGGVRVTGDLLNALLPGRS